MPFRSEKQRRFLWAEHPEIAKRWAHEYPESNKGLPMYAKKTDKQKKAEKAAVLSVMKAAVSKIACLGDGSILGGNSDAVSKEANSGMVRVDMPNNEKPTYAGEEQEKGEAKPVENAGECSDPKKQDENAVTALFGKLSAVLARPLREAMELEQALMEGREPLYVPENLGVRRFSAPSPSIMPPMGMAPQPQQTAQTQPQQQGQAKPVGGGSNPQFNPINAFGAISSSGQINGNAAFGQKHSPGSSKIAAQNPALAALMGLAAETNVDPDELADTIDAALGKSAGLFSFMQPSAEDVAKREHSRQLYAMYQKVQQDMAAHKKQKLAPTELAQLHEQAMAPLYQKQMEFMYNNPALFQSKSASKPCSCGCGDTVATCKCGPSCKCRKPGGSCYKTEKKAGTPAWQRSEGKNDEGGLNEKGRKSYEREHGGDLKAPVTESNPSGERAKRQNSFCSRMCGMKRVNTGAKTKSDPDSRINKSLRKWNCKCSSAHEFGEKLAELDPNLNLVYDKAKTNFMMPKYLRENKLSPEQASQLLAGMRAVAPHGALDKTRLDWNGLQIQGYGSRVHDNERVTRLGRWLHQFDGDQFESAYPDKTQGFGDAFLPFANLVSVPSGMGGVAMHELGHAIDFNGFPADSTPRHLIAATYRNYAPTIWKEHAAWRKGRKAVLDAYSKEKIDPQTTFQTLESGKGAKRVGLGSYWGAGLGTVGGIGATLAGMLALNEMGVDLRHIPGRALALPIVGGAMLGGIGGVGLGNLLAKNPTKREVIVNMMAKQLARKNGMRYEAARSLVEQQLAATDKAPAQPMRKAAELRAFGEKLAAQPNPFAAGASLYTPMLQGARNNLAAARVVVPPVARFAGNTIGGPGVGGVTSLASKLGLNHQLNNVQAQLATLKKLQQPATPALKRPTP